MDYKQKYEQALERCKKEFDFNNLAYSHEEIKQRLEHVFPELKEDERIRKALIQHIKYKVSVISGWRKEELIAWLEKQKDHEDELERAYKCADEVQYRKGFEDGVASVKPDEWSEEDEWMCKNLLECLRYGWRKLPTDVSKYESWLKSLKPQPKQEWSKKDEKLLNLSLENLTELKNRFGEKYGKVGDCINWLKSLKQRMKGETK